MHPDAWNIPMPKVERVADDIGIRVVSKLLVDPSESGYRSPQSRLERWLGGIARGANIDLDAEATEIRSGYHLGAIAPFDRYRQSRSRVILDIRGPGIIPELDDQKVLVQASSIMMHRASMYELENGIFVNEVKLTPYTSADPTKR